MIRTRSPKPDLYSAQCPSREILDHVTSKWGSLLLVLLLEKSYRFSELRRRIGGISEKMLAQSLQLLEKDGFVDRHAYAEVPPRVEYSLTPLGRQVAERVEALTEWVEGNLGKVMTFRNKNQVTTDRPSSAKGRKP